MPRAAHAHPLARVPSPPDVRPPADLDVARAQRGDVAAFERLYAAHAGRVFALCTRLGGGSTEGRELAQDVFVRAWERLAQFRGESAFATWLHRLAVNVALERVRGERRRESRVESVADPASREAGAAAPPRRLTAEERMDLERAVATLPPRERAVFVLHDVYGYSHPEIAGVTGAAEGTVRAQLFHARRRLTEILRDD